MDTITYPTLRVTVLQGLRDLKELFNANPEILKAGSCPYDPETIEILTQILTSKVIIKTVEAIPVDPILGGGLLSGEDKDLIEQTIGDLLKELRELGEGERTLDTQTKITIIKAKATLIDQMLKSHERIMNVKRIAAFQSIIIGILDDFVGEADRVAFLKRIEIYND